MRALTLSAFFAGAYLVLSPLRAENDVVSSTLTAIADTFIKEDHAHESFGSASFIRSRSRGPDRIALIRFDPDALGSDEATEATLSLHVVDFKAPGSVHVGQIVSPWDENDVTFSSRPSIDDRGVGSRQILAADIGSRVAFDISPILDDWRANPDRNFGIAIIAEDHADVRFGSREAGLPAQLELKSPDTVIVSQHGGDYADPVTAAENAHAGDRWCTAATFTCVMRIEEGIYILPRTLVIPERVRVEGAGRSATLLIAARGLELAARSESVLRMRALSLINRQDESLDQVATLLSVDAVRLTDVGLRAEGGVSNVALRLRDGHSVIEDSDIAAAGGTTTLGIDADGFDSSEVIVHSRITATGGTDRNVGMHDNSGGSVVLEDSVVLASGGLQTIALVWEDEVGNYQVFGGTIAAFGDDGAERVAGIAPGDFTSSLRVAGAHIEARGPEASTAGISWQGPIGPLFVDDAVVRSSGSAILLPTLDNDSDVLLTVFRSQLIGARVIELPRAGFGIEIEQSVLDGGQWAVNSGGSSSTIFTIVDSILHGTADLSEATAHCTGALNGDYEPLAEDCVTVQ